MFGSSAQPETLTSCASWVDTPSPSSAAPAASAPPADKNAGGKFEQRLMSNLQRLYITRISASLLLSNFTCAYAACLALLTPPGFPIDTRLTEPELTPDPAMPSLLRDATHDFCDAVWKELSAELQAYFSDQDRQDAPAKTSAPPADPPPSPPSDDSTLLGHSALVSMGSDQPIMQGFLSKLSGGHRARWTNAYWGSWLRQWWGDIREKSQRRWFVLERSGKLSWFNPEDAFALLRLPPPPPVPSSEESSAADAVVSTSADEADLPRPPPMALNTLSCLGARVQTAGDENGGLVTSGPRSCDFQLVTGERVLTLRAKSVEEAEQWLAALVNLQASQPSQEAPVGATGPGSNSAAGSGNPSAASASSPYGWLSELRKAASRMRCHLLYHYLPFDKTLFGQLRSPVSFGLLCLASWPESISPLVRPAFFTLLLACLLVDRSTYQLRNFIIQLKGTQFLSAIYVLFSGFASFYYCTALAPSRLPLAPTADDSMPAREDELASAASRAGLQHDGGEGGLEAALSLSGPGVKVDIFQSMLSLLWLQLLTWFTMWLCPPSKDKRGKRRSQSKAATSAAVTSPSASAARDGGAESNRTDTPGRTSEAGVGGECWSALVPEQMQNRGSLLIWLLRWDLRCFALCLSVGGLLVLAVAGQQAEDAQLLQNRLASADDVDGSHPAWRSRAIAVLRLLGDEENFWRGWRMSVTLFFVRTTYQLTTLPFFIFWLPGLDYLFARAAPATGYNPHGACLPKDGAGLSAYLCEVEYQLSQSSVRAALSTEQVAHLEDSIASAREWLEEIDWSIKPGNTKLKAGLLRNELQSTLCAFVPPSHPLWKSLFPSRHRCRAYENALATSGELHATLATEQKSTAEKSERFDVDYQSKESVSECRLCGKKFFLGFAILRRSRHHCKLCGMVTCDACTRHSRQVRCADGKLNLERVCDVCDSVWHLTRHNQFATNEAGAAANRGEDTNNQHVTRAEVVSRSELL